MANGAVPKVVCYGDRNAPALDLTGGKSVRGSRNAILVNISHILQVQVRRIADGHVAHLPETFNNCLGFERGFWWRKMGCFECVPKRSSCGEAFEYSR